MMRCPLCERDVRNVIDTRGLEGGTVIRRRRKCVSCEHRFTTYERGGDGGISHGRGQAACGCRRASRCLPCVSGFHES